MVIPDLNLRLNTLYILNSEGRILSTREPGAKRGPLFALVRNERGCDWAFRVDVPPDLVSEIEQLARKEPPAFKLRSPPMFADRYLSLLGGVHDPGCEGAAGVRLYTGPAFTFPDTITKSADVVLIEEEGLLAKHFQGWAPGEIAAGRSPALAIIEDEYPVSICFCARRSASAAEAGLDTAEAYRGRGLGPRVTAAWALAIRASGRIPLYSTSWTNTASLAVARKLGLTAYACDWNLSE